jgi:DNA-binding transcriptional ArsR family regulator
MLSDAALEREPGLARRFRNILALDPPISQGGRWPAGEAGERTYMAWGPAELRFALHTHEREYGLRSSLAASYRALRDRGEVAGRELEAILRGEAPSPEAAGRLLLVLTEVGLIALDRERAAVTVTERSRVTLEHSAAYRHYEQTREDGLTYLGLTTAQAA